MSEGPPTIRKSSESIIRSHAGFIRIFSVTTLTAISTAKLRLHLPGWPRLTRRCELRTYVRHTTQRLVSSQCKTSEILLNPTKVLSDRRKRHRNHHRTLKEPRRVLLLFLEA